MLLMDEYSAPLASWCDTYIVQWARCRGYGKRPVEKFRFAEVVSPEHDDTVEIDFTYRPAVVRRFNSK